MRRFLLAFYVFVVCAFTLAAAYTIGPALAVWYTVKWTLRGALFSGYASWTRGIANFLPSKDARQLLLRGIMHPLKTATKELNDA